MKEAALMERLLFFGLYFADQLPDTVFRIAEMYRAGF